MAYGSMAPTLDGGHNLLVDLIDMVNSSQTADQSLVVYHVRTWMACNKREPRTPSEDHWTIHTKWPCFQLDSKVPPHNLVLSLLDAGGMNVVSRPGGRSVVVDLLPGK